MRGVLLLVSGGAPCDFASSLALGPLAAADREALFVEQLGLERSLARHVDAQTSGNPGLAIGLLADLAENGELAVTDRGVSFRRPSPIAQRAGSDSVHAGARRTARARALFASVPAAERSALEMLALLGDRVDVERWRAACDAAGIEVRPSLIDRLAMEQLAELADGRWLLADEVLAAGWDAGAARETIALAADVLCAEGSARGLTRAASLYQRAERPDRASECFAAAADRQLRALDFDRARENAQRAAELAGRRQDHATELRASLIEAAAARVLGELDHAATLARETHRRVRTQAPTLAAEAAHLRARIERSLGDPTLALRYLLEAEHHARASGDLGRAADAIVDQAAMLVAAGAHESAISRVDDAATIYTERGDAVGVALTERLRARLFAQHGRISDARAMLERALEGFRRARKRGPAADVSSDLGDLALREGDLGRAEAILRGAVEASVALGNTSALAELRLGLTLLARRAFEEASMHLEGAVSAWRALRDRTQARAAALALAVVAAVERDWDRLVELLDEFSPTAELAPHQPWLLAVLREHTSDAPAEVRRRVDAIAAAA